MKFATLEMLLKFVEDATKKILAASFLPAMNSGEKGFESV